VLDGRNDPVKSSAADTGDADDEAPLMAAEESKDEEKDAIMDEDWRSITEPLQPLTNDRSSRFTVCMYTLITATNVQLLCAF